MYTCCRYDVVVIGRAYSSLAHSKWLSWADLAVSQGVGIVLRPYSSLSSAAGGRSLIHTMTALSLQYRTCWVILYQQDKNRSANLYTEVVFISGGPLSEGSTVVKTLVSVVFVVMSLVGVSLSSCHCCTPPWRPYTPTMRSKSSWPRPPPVWLNWCAGLWRKLTTWQMSVVKCGHLFCCYCCCCCCCCLGCWPR